MQNISLIFFFVMVFCAAICSGCMVDELSRSKAEAMIKNALSEEIGQHAGDIDINTLNNEQLTMLMQSGIVSGIELSETGNKYVNINSPARYLSFFIVNLFELEFKSVEEVEI